MTKDIWDVSKFCFGGVLGRGWKIVRGRVESCEGEELWRVEERVKSWGGGL